MYETLKLTDDNGNVDMHARYTTTTQSAANGYYAVSENGRSLLQWSNSSSIYFSPVFRLG